MLRRIDIMVLTPRGRIVDIRNIDMFDNKGLKRVSLRLKRVSLRLKRVSLRLKRVFLRKNQEKKSFRKSVKIKKATAQICSQIAKFTRAQSTDPGREHRPVQKLHVKYLGHVTSRRLLKTFYVLYPKSILSSDLLKQRGKNK